MRRRRRWAPYALAAWTAFVWITRIRNAEAGDVGPILLSAVFLLLAALVLATKGHALPTTTLAGLTVVVWVIRLPMILLADHGAGFEVVHAVIALVSLGLAFASSDALNRGRRPAPA
jgi:hypothetical protein